MLVEGFPNLTPIELFLSLNSEDNMVIGRGVSYLTLSVKKDLEKQTEELGGGICNKSLLLTTDQKNTYIFLHKYH